MHYVRINKQRIFLILEIVFKVKGNLLGPLLKKKKKGWGGGAEKDRGKEKLPVPSSNLSVCAHTNGCVCINVIRMCLCLLFTVANHSFKSHGFAMCNPLTHPRKQVPSFQLN